MSHVCLFVCDCCVWRMTYPKWVKIDAKHDQSIKTWLQAPTLFSDNLRVLVLGRLKRPLKWSVAREFSHLSSLTTEKCAFIAGTRVHAVDRAGSYYYFGRSRKTVINHWRHRAARAARPRQGYPTTPGIYQILRFMLSWRLLNNYNKLYKICMNRQYGQINLQLLMHDWYRDVVGAVMK
eukprot:sb/3471781/